MKKKVLIMAGYYEPAFKGGGPIRSIKNLVNNLCSEVEFYIIASDRDLGDDRPFENVIINKWHNVKNAKVYYTDKSTLNWRDVRKLIASVDYDVLYLNSFFSFRDSIIPILLNKFNLIPKKPIILAPRGQFSSGALILKNTKKRAYIEVAKKINLYRGIKWHATANSEKQDIKNIFGEEMSIDVVSNLNSNNNDLVYNKDLSKNSGSLKIIFISRIHPKKNLKKAIEILGYINGSVEFNIYGPIEDDKYWKECELLINNLPTNILVNYEGVLNHNQVNDAFNNNHVFLFPTLGENFGHVILEALTASCPIIISDQTPWRNLQDVSAGWDINLNDEDEFIKVIQYLVDMDNCDYQNLSKSAFEYGLSAVNNQTEIIKYRNLFK